MVYPREASAVGETEREKIGELMDKLGLGERKSVLKDIIKKNWSTLSEGEQKRVAVIRMLMQTPMPKVLFMDEATANVDQENAEKMQQLIKKFLPDAVIIYVDHHSSKPENAAIPLSFGEGTISIEDEQLKVSGGRALAAEQGRNEETADTSITTGFFSKKTEADGLRRRAPYGR
jgi:ABC-type uncharacterized transport system fused permease/ATPase subunit